MSGKRKSKAVDEVLDERAVAIASINDAVSKFAKERKIFLRRGSEIPYIGPEDCISTGNVTVDRIFTGYGIPMRSMVEIYGPESSGKTTLALSTVASAQRQGIRCVYIDVENAINADYYRMSGVDDDELLIAQPDTAEDTFDCISRLLLLTEADPDVGFGLIVVDSIAAMVPSSQIGANSQERGYAGLPLLMSRELPKIMGALRKSRSTLIWINQERDNISSSSFGPQKKTPGGNSIKFYMGLRARMVRTKSETIGDEAYAQIGEVKTTKNKFGAWPARGKVRILFGHDKVHGMTGLSAEVSVVEEAVRLGIIKKKGESSYYDENGEKLGIGMYGVAWRLKSKPDVMRDLESRVRSMIHDEIVAARSEREIQEEDVIDEEE